MSERCVIIQATTADQGRDLIKIPLRFAGYPASAGSYKNGHSGGQRDQIMTLLLTGRQL